MRPVVIVGYSDAMLLEIACTADAFDVANRLGATPGYRVRLAGPEQGPMHSSSGMTLLAPHRLDRIDGPLDTLIVAGGPGSRTVVTDGPTLAHVRRLAASSRRVASICSGAFVLAAVGLLDGRRATTHWQYANELARQYPRVTVDPAPLFVKDGPVYTGAGVTSALDLSLALIEEDHGPTLARELARSLVVYLQRPGNQAQVSMFLAAPPPEHRVVRDLTAHIAGNLGADLGTAALAARAGTSTRQLSRLFDTHLGTTPSRYVRAVRTEAAAQLLSSTDLPLTAVARRCGFGSTETLRQTFLDHYGTAPSAYRRTYRCAVSASS
ncbi:GlxA family transcriptional regulator [Nocardia mexicana]|uniref:AraC family transcriptional regulator with amidase-like domain n=1 Tax=Nocardia mexicana TaxID=279262 RepID=A0A370H9L6_9NOCA|nr:GlxA family transcriptional regulator [Nocardia mexicana]RDI53357.1 AraC family transcriptional regulator with amidase-like domain [Nocardia mexicana]